jgi:threonine/homoserine/homoserine lactone efflux protein
LAILLARKTKAANIKDTVASAKLLLIQKASTEGLAVQLINPFSVLWS